MKKNILYILLIVIVGAAIGIFISNNKWNGERKFDQRLTLHKRDKIPYGLNVAFSNLHTLFPDGDVTVSRKEPGEWESISADSSGQALVIITPDFNADEYELKQLVEFAEAGNDIFLSSRSLSPAAQQVFNCAAPEGPEMYMPVEYLSDTLEINLDDRAFQGPHQFTFPGKRFSNRFSATDAATTTVLGTDKAGHPDFIRLRAGAGNFYVHLAPIAFSNYFLLHKSNLDYYEQALSVIPSSTERIVWDEYYRYKTEEQPKSQKNWLSVLMNIKNSEDQKPFKAALLVAMGLLLLYVLLGLRRRQRIIPIIPKPSNATLDFTKTIGRLYHDKGDHANLARKMTAYFLEHVRNRYKIATNMLDDSFVKQLHLKTGVDESLITSIVQSVHSIDHESFTAQQLATLHKQLENFYKTA